MGSVTAYIDDQKGGWNGSVYDGTGFNLVKVDGQYVKKIELDIVSASHMNRGWDSYQGHDLQIGATRIGKRTLWDYSENGFVRTLKSSIPTPLSLNQVGFSGYHGSSYPKTRDGGYYKIKHQTYSWLSEAYANNVPTPTFRITIADPSVINLNAGYDYTYEEWGDVNTGSPCAQHGITVYKKPYVADQTMTVTSSTTANMYYPENGSAFVILKQPTVYGSIGITDNTDMTSALSGYSTISSIWQHNYSNGEIVGDTGDWFQVKILAYIPDWDSIGDISYSWNVTGDKKTQFNPMAGTINSFAQVTGNGSTWESYAVGYQQIYLERGKLTAPHYTDATLTANLNIVPNGLVFDSGTQTKALSVVA